MDGWLYEFKVFIIKIFDFDFSFESRSLVWGMEVWGFCPWERERERERREERR